LDEHKALVLKFSERLRKDGSGFVASSCSHLLYGAFASVLDVASDRDVSALESGVTLAPAFAWNRTCYDLFLNQEGRIQRGSNRETYVRRLAECGFTHVEVNGLAFPMGLETGPKGEVYPMFYTYCPALDQFVHSRLNKGLYPFYYLSANLEYLKQNAALARKYGLPLEVLNAMTQEPGTRIPDPAVPAAADLSP
jgi:hypothetical protein